MLLLTLNSSRFDEWERLGKDSRVPSSLPLRRELMLALKCTNGIPTAEDKQAGARVEESEACLESMRDDHPEVLTEEDDKYHFLFHHPSF
jgi:hypothetical protein